jgi:hypothetical protein
MVLPDGAAKDIEPRWFEEGENIRVADAFVVDFMLNANGQTYDTLRGTGRYKAPGHDRKFGVTNCPSLTPFVSIDERTIFLWPICCSWIALRFSTARSAAQGRFGRVVRIG